VFRGFPEKCKVLVPGRVESLKSGEFPAIFVLSCSGLINPRRLDLIVQIQSHSTNRLLLCSLLFQYFLCSLNFVLGLLDRASHAFSDSGS
jgi:hypothetical protein